MLHINPTHASDKIKKVFAFQTINKKRTEIYAVSSQFQSHLLQPFVSDIYKKIYTDSISRFLLPITFNSITNQKREFHPLSV